MSSSSNFKTPLPMGEGLGVRLLKQYWGYDTFRGIQEDIINSITEGRDTLGLMPTGGGKSITFQVPALAKEGLCLVITPLIALMKDQVQNLKKRGIKALAIYSGMSRQEIIVTLENCIFGNFKFLYISPERLDTEIFRTKLQKMKISMITVDESHCISQWGYDFRPAYLKIAEIRTLLPGVPVLALTATATPEVVKDIQARLHFREENVFCMSFERKNLAYIVRKTETRRESCCTSCAVCPEAPSSMCATVAVPRKLPNCCTTKTSPPISTMPDWMTPPKTSANNAGKQEKAVSWSPPMHSVWVSTNRMYGLSSTWICPIP